MVNVLIAQILQFPLCEVQQENPALRSVRDQLAILRADRLDDLLADQLDDLLNNLLEDPLEDLLGCLLATYSELHEKRTLVQLLVSIRRRIS